MFVIDRPRLDRTHVPQDFLVEFQVLVPFDRNISERVFPVRSSIFCGLVAGIFTYEFLKVRSILRVQGVGFEGEVVLGESEVPVLAELGSRPDGLFLESIF